MLCGVESRQEVPQHPQSTKPPLKVLNFLQPKPILSCDRLWSLWRDRAWIWGAAPCGEEGDFDRVFDGVCSAITDCFFIEGWIWFGQNFFACVFPLFSSFWVYWYLHLFRLFLLGGPFFEFLVDDGGWFVVIFPLLFLLWLLFFPGLCLVVVSVVVAANATSANSDVLTGKCVCVFFFGNQGPSFFLVIGIDPRFQCCADGCAGSLIVIDRSRLLWAGTC